MMFKTVPRPGFCFKGIHKARTPIPEKKVAHPILNPVCTDIPCAKTVQGETPALAEIRNASPVPNNQSPTTKIKIVEGLETQ